MSAIEPVGRATRVASILIALSCVSWLLVSAWGAAQYRQASHFGPVLYDPLSVAVDPEDGSIYCASGAGRIQKYGGGGRGRGAFWVDTGGAPFRIVSEGPGLVAMAVQGWDRVVIFDKAGQVASERDQPGAWSAWADSAHGARSGDGTREVILLHGALIERRTSGAPEERLLVPAITFPLTLFAAAPWTLVLSLFLSTLGLMAAFIWPFMARPAEDAVR